MNVELRKKIEREIATKVVDCVLARDYDVTVDNGGDQAELTCCKDRETILKAMFATDEETLSFRNRHNEWCGEVDLVYGNNGWDVIADYSVRLEETIKPALELADQYSK